jgi:hypothetical protein
LASKYDGAPLYWTDESSANPNATLTASAIIDRVIRDFSPSQRRRVRRAESVDAILAACPQNFNGFSECYAAVVFAALGDGPGAVNYTLRADGGLYHINVEGGKSDYEQRVMPLQFAIDQVGISLASPWVFLLIQAHSGYHRASDRRRGGHSAGMAVHAADKQGAGYEDPSEYVLPTVCGCVAALLTCPVRLHPRAAHPTRPRALHLLRRHLLPAPRRLRHRARHPPHRPPPRDGPPRLCPHPVRHSILSISSLLN